jgi:hypothetical protein
MPKRLIAGAGPRPKSVITAWLEAEVEYSSTTDDGLLRSAVFKGLRDDVAVPKVKAPPTAPRMRQARAPHIGVPRANILQLLPDAVVPTKTSLPPTGPEFGRRPCRIWATGRSSSSAMSMARRFYHKGPLPKDIPEAVHQLRLRSAISMGHDLSKDLQMFCGARLLPCLIWMRVARSASPDRQTSRLSRDVPWRPNRPHSSSSA